MIILSFITLSVHAADTTTILQDADSLFSDVFCYFGGGLYYQPMDEFNDVMLERGIEDIPEKIALIALGFYSLTKRQRFGLDFETIWSRPAKTFVDTSSINAVKVRGFLIAFRYGFNMTSRSERALRPMFGVGYFQHAYDFQPRFNDVLDRKVDEKLIIRNKGLVLSAGANIHFHSKLKESMNKGDIENSMMGFDLDVGVNYYPVRSMKYLRNTISDGPNMSPYGVYAKLSVTFGGKEKKNTDKKKKKNDKLCKG